MILSDCVNIFKYWANCRIIENGKCSMFCFVVTSQWKDNTWSFELHWSTMLNHECVIEHYSKKKEQYNDAVGYQI